jgi:uncharacterized protein YggT (Ycf19 family)
MEHYDGSAPRAQSLYRITQFVWFIFSVIEAILLFRFILKLIGANTAAGFTQFIYAISQPFVRPFLYVVSAPSIYGTSVIDWASVIALFVYWFVAWGILRLILLARPLSRRQASRRLDREDPDA